MKVMKMKCMHVKTLTLGGVALVAMLAAPVSAQQIKVGAKVGEPATSSGGYDSLGHRDPFVSLIAVRRGTTPAAPRVGTGLASFFVADIKISGIVKKGDVWMAIIEGMGKQSYVAKVRDRLADAVVKSIDATSVVFIETGEPGSFGRSREIRKLLRAVDEVNR
jgi:hypothetical protein